MNKPTRPETLGVFSPVGYVVISFPTQPDMEAAASALEGEGYGAGDVVRYTAEQMMAQTRIDLAKASPIADLGQEANLVRTHAMLAEKGYCFLVVHAPKDADAHEVAEIAKTFHADRAQKYGHFLIEELIEAGDDETQVFESPDRGLDAQTVSGKEKTPDHS